MKLLNHQYLEHFRITPRVNPTFGICIKVSSEEINFKPNIIAKFQFPETSPWTYPINMVNLTLSYAKKVERDPSIYCRMANFSVSFIFLFFPECLQMVINNIGKNNTLHVRT